MHNDVHQVADQVKNLSNRLGKLECRVGTLAHSAKPWIEILTGIFQALVPLLLFILGFQLKDLYEQSVQERRLHLENVVEMRDLIRDLSLGTDPEPIMRSKAATLAAYGPPAVVPFIRILDTEGGPNQVKVATFGLRALAWSDSATVCRALVRVIQDNSGLFLWQTHEAAFQMITAIHSMEAQCVVREAARDTALGREEFARRYRNPDNLSFEAFASIKNAMADYARKVATR